jgi:hypothetical protein
MLCSAETCRDILIQINIGKPRPHFVEIETMIALGQGTVD